MTKTLEQELDKVIEDNIDLIVPKLPTLGKKLALVCAAAPDTLINILDGIYTLSIQNNVKYVILLHKNNVPNYISRIITVLRSSGVLPHTVEKVISGHVDDISGLQHIPEDVVARALYDACGREDAYATVQFTQLTEEAQNVWRKRAARFIEMPAFLSKVQIPEPLLKEEKSG